MKTTLKKSKERGSANFGWLHANYSFSFANYFNPAAIQFGALRVLNDDFVQPNTGFGKHPHRNMEIITIPLKGSLKHKDSMSEIWQPLHTGEVQVMSAGSGLQHSEMNLSTSETLNLFQIWILPQVDNVEPTYNQKKFKAADRKDKLQYLVSSINNPLNGTLTINQEAYISRIDLSAENDFEYKLNYSKNGVYVMTIYGSVIINNELLNPRDAIMVEETKAFNLKATEDAEILLIEVPMIIE